MNIFINRRIVYAYTCGGSRGSRGSSTWRAATRVTACEASRAAVRSGMCVRVCMCAHCADMECVLTTLSLSRAAGGGGAQLLRAGEQARATSILQRALRAERAGTAADTLHLTEEHPDGREY